MKANVIIAVLVFSAGSILFWGLFDSAKAKPEQTQAQAQPTQAQSQPTPTLIIPTATAQPTATNTPQPTATAFPSPVPSPTQDVEYQRKVNEEQARARREQLALDRQELELRIKSLIAWGVFIFAIFFGALGVFAFGNASVKSWQNARKSQSVQQNAPQGNRKAQEAFCAPSIHDNPEFPEQWLDSISWKDGKIPPENPEVYKLFGGQGEYRAMIWNMQKVGWAEKFGADGWYVTEKFADEVGREIEAPRNVHSV